MSAAHTALLVIDVQEKLVPWIQGHERVVWNIRRLLDGARLLGVEVFGTEQYRKGLGPMVPELAARLPAMPEKETFSCGGCPEVFQSLRAAGRHQILVVGIESHVCVAQTVLDLLANGFQVFVAVDAVGSR